MVKTSFARRAVRNAIKACERPQVGTGMSASKKSFDQLMREKGIAKKG